MSVSVKRKPIYCGSCSMDLTNAVRIRCAQLGPPLPPASLTTATMASGGAEAQLSTSASAAADSSPTKATNGVAVEGKAAEAHMNGSTTKKHDSIDALPTGPRSDGLVPTCEDFDICGTCFCEGKEVGRHKRWHDYRVITQHAYPIFTDDWGADEELLLISACQSFGLGNWADIAEHIGSYRTKEEVEEHYLSTYIYSPNFPLPVTDVKLIDQDTFQARKRRRLEEAQDRPVPIPPPKPLASAPTCHEIAGYMPGRLEFETEWENDAEALIKDMEFGAVLRYGGDQQPTREEAMAAHGASATGLQPDNKAALENRQPQAAAPSSRGLGASASAPAGENGEIGEGEGAGTFTEEANGGQASAQAQAPAPTAPSDSLNDGVASANQTAEKGKEDQEKDETVIASWEETDDDLELKLTMHEIYNERIARRLDAKNVIFERGLLEYKKLVAIEKKRPREERDLLNRIKVFSRLQTALDHEEFANGLLYEQMLRKTVLDLQDYRQAGLTTLAEVDKYEKDKATRIQLRGLNNYREALLYSRSGNFGGRNGSGQSSREGTPKPPGYGGNAGSSISGIGGSSTNASGTATSTTPARKGQGPQLTLANSASLQLLSSEEQKLCSELRILPKPYLYIKQTLLREFARCGGKLERERALELLAKVSEHTVLRIWEELFGAIEEVAAEAEDSDEDDSDDDNSDDDDRGAGDDDDDDDDDSDDSDGEPLANELLLQNGLIVQQDDGNSLAGDAAVLGATANANAGASPIKLGVKLDADDAGEESSSEDEGDLMGELQALQEQQQSLLASQQTEVAGQGDLMEL